MKRIAPVVASLALCAGLPLNSAMSADTDLAVQGRVFAEKNCANCHAVGKEGASKLPIAPPFRTLSSKYPVENLEEALAEGIVTSHPAMPVFQLDPLQIAALIEHLNSLND